MLYHFARFSVEGPLRIETFSYVKCVIVIEIYKEQICVFCWFSIVKVFIFQESITILRNFQFNGVDMGKKYHRALKLCYQLYDFVIR